MATAKMNLARIALVAITVTALQGCDQLVQPDKTPPVARASNRPRTYIHRFVMTHDGGVAFDTQTGQICRTWDWKLTGEPAKADASGNIPQRTFGELTPTCLSLYETYPSGMDTDTEAASPDTESGAP